MLEKCITSTIRWEEIKWEHVKIFWDVYKCKLGVFNNKSNSASYLTIWLCVYVYPHISETHTYTNIPFDVKQNLCNRKHTHTHTHTYAHARTHARIRARAHTHTHANTRRHTQGLMRQYMSQTKSRYSGFSPLKSHPDSVIAVLDPLIQYLRIMQPKETHTHASTHVQTHTNKHNTTTTFYRSNNRQSVQKSRLTVK